MTDGDDEEMFDNDQKAKKKKSKKGAKKYEGHKFENVDMVTYNHILKQSPAVTPDF